MKSFFSIPWKRLAVYGAFFLVACVAYLVWSPGASRTDGAHDRGQNGIWVQHGWIGDDAWFKRHGKQERMAHFRSKPSIRQLAELSRAHGIRDVYPHLAPCREDGALLEPDHEQLERLLDVLGEERIMPWVGGVYKSHVRPDDKAWRQKFIADVNALLVRHPRLAGVHLNIEPWPSGDPALKMLLEELHSSMPQGKILSLASYPPPVPVVGNLEVHWTPEYITLLSKHVDQMVFMNYDSGLKASKLYVLLQERWVHQILAHTKGTEVLIGLPAYEDDWAPWHDPRVENLNTGLAGLHSALDEYDVLPENYRGVSLYSDWEMQPEEWETFSRQFVKK